MDKLLQPKVLELNVDDASSSRTFQHWKSVCETFMDSLTLPASYLGLVTDEFTREMATDKMKRDVLNTLVHPDVWFDIKDCNTYDDAMTVLTNLFVKSPSEVFARYRLLSAKQAPDQSLESFRRDLERLSRDCNFKTVSAIRNREDSMLDAFISGIAHADIRKRLFEEKTLTFNDAFKLALTLHDGHKEAKMYEQAGTSFGNLSLNATSQARNRHLSDDCDDDEHKVVVAAGYQPLCDACGKRFCRQDTCTGVDATCYNCGENGHKAPQCKKPPRSRPNRGKQKKRNRRRYLNTAQEDDHLNASSQNHVSENNNNSPRHASVFLLLYRTSTDANVRL